MKVRLAAIGRRPPKWVAQGFDTYVKRLPRELRFELIEIPSAKHPEVGQRQSAEGDKLLAAARGKVIALDERGSMLTSQDLAQHLSHWQLQGQDVTLLVGGADGLSDKVRASVDAMWSISGLTLPHYMVRLVLGEALYRAVTINSGHPYHRE